MSTRLHLNTRLRPGILEWDISSTYNISPKQHTKFRKSATSPPCSSMTLTIPGLPFNLPPLEASHSITRVDYVTVEEVLEFIHHIMNNCQLGDIGYKAVRGDQKESARAACCVRTRTAVLMEAQDEEELDKFFQESMRGVDLVGGRVKFGGLLLQQDVNGANVWVVGLQKPQDAASDEYMHRVLEPGRTTWDFKDPPPVLNGSRWRCFGMAGHALDIVDLAGHQITSIPPPSNAVCTHPFTLAMILKSIHDAVNLNDTVLGANNGRFLTLWDNSSSNEGAAHCYTLLTQPSARRVYTIHPWLRQGHVERSLFANPAALSSSTSGMAWLDKPATSPGRKAMVLSIEFMPGVSWTLAVFPALGDKYVTACQLLARVHEFLAKERFEISWVKMPIHLQRRMKRCARRREKRMNANAGADASIKPGQKGENILGSSPGTDAGHEAAAETLPKPKVPKRKPSKDPKLDLYAIMTKEELWQQRRKRQRAPPKGFKRVDVLGVTICTGFEHRIGQFGEDEWVVCLGA